MLCKNSFVSTEKGIEKNAFQMYSRSKKHPYLFQYKLSYSNETGANHHGLLSTSISRFKIILRYPSTWGVSA